MRMTRRSFMMTATAGAAVGVRAAATVAKSGSFTHLLDGIGRENIKITSVRPTRLTYIPPKGEYVEEAGPIVNGSRNILVLEVFTDRGIVGIGGGGEAGPLEDYSRHIGKNPFDLELLGLADGIEIACWDIIGKAKGMPVYKLLATDNEPNPVVHVYASAGENWTFYDKGNGKPYGIDALIEEALQYKETGYDCFKFRPGTDWESAGMNVEKFGNNICRRLREAVGPDLKLALERIVYEGWTVEECLQIAPVINDLNFHWFEQPMGDIGPTQFEDYLKIKEQMPHVMLFGGESFRNLAEARPFIEQHIYDGIQTDCTHRGMGITESWLIARVAGFNGLKTVPHSWISAIGTVANAHLCAGVPSGYLCEYFTYPHTPFRDELLSAAPVPKNSHITLSDKPGLGIELANLEALKRAYPYDPHAPGIFPNPRFPHAIEKARIKLNKVNEKYKYCCFRPCEGSCG